MAVLSATVYTTRDHAGNPRTEAWLTLEFTGGYEVLGQSFDLSPYFKRLDYIQTMPMSGTVLRALLSGGGTTGIGSGVFWNSGESLRVRPVVDDYATPASARFQLLGFVTGPSSGFGEMVLASGPAAAISGIRFAARAIGG